MWINNCGHDGYIDSFTYLNHTYDLYVFDDDQEICIRYGNENNEYISPGNLNQLILSSFIDPIKQKAIATLINNGKLVFNVNSKGVI